MRHTKSSLALSTGGRGLWFVFVSFVLVVSLPALLGVNLGYTESKGPFKNWTQVVDWDADGDLDVIVSHTRWEQVDESWAGVGIWINQGDGTFELLRDRGTGSGPLAGSPRARGTSIRTGTWIYLLRTSGSACW